MLDVQGQKLVYLKYGKSDRATYSNSRKATMEPMLSARASVAPGELMSFSCNL